MKGFDDLLDISRDELDERIPSDFQLKTSFEESVFKKIGKRKKQIRVNVTISIMFAIFGAFFGYFIINDAHLDRNINSVPIIAGGKKLDTIKKEKEEVWATDDIYFSTYDDKANYAIEQVSLTNYDEEI